jgi:hypothetical protein
MNARSFFITKAALLSHCQAQEYFLTRLSRFRRTTHTGKSRPSVSSKFHRMNYWTNLDDILSLYNIYSGEFNFGRMEVLLHVMFKSSFTNFLKSAHHTSKIVNAYSVHLTDAFGRRNYKLYINIHALKILIRRQRSWNKKWKWYYVIPKIPYLKKVGKRCEI